MPNVQETLDEGKSVVEPPKPHDADIVHPTSQEASIPEELAVAAPTEVKLESRATDSAGMDILEFDGY